MKIKRRKAKVIKIGNCLIGGNNPVAIQSMVKTKTSNLQGTLSQIRNLERAGCEIVRLAIKDSLDSQALRAIKKKVRLPIVADIHFNWHLALEAIDNGADKIRLNPGNIYRRGELKEIISALKSAKIPLRIGVNSGSLRGSSKKLSIADRLVASLLNYLRIIERLGFNDIVLSLKASNVLDTVEAYRKIARICSYPLHLGVTATGSPYKGRIKSSIALGALLLEGIGDTIRVSLTDDPIEEVRAAEVILESLGLRSFGPEVISCPTCGRCEVDLVKLVKEFENKLSSMDCGLGTVDSQPFRVAIMGCMVNGPGEAKGVDIGVAFGKRDGLLFKKGKPVKKIHLNNCVDLLLREIKKR